MRYLQFLIFLVLIVPITFAQVGMDSCSSYFDVDCSDSREIFFLIAVPFLAIFVLTTALLRQLRVLGDGLVSSAIIGLVAALFSLQGGGLRNLFTRILGSEGSTATIFFMLIVITAVAGIAYKILKKQHGELKREIYQIRKGKQ